MGLTWEPFSKKGRGLGFISIIIFEGGGTPSRFSIYFPFIFFHRTKQIFPVLVLRLFQPKNFSHFNTANLYWQYFSMGKSKKIKAREYVVSKFELL